jgi:hypothetical protein
MSPSLRSGSRGISFVLRSKFRLLPFDHIQQRRREDRAVPGVKGFTNGAWLAIPIMRPGWHFWKISDSRPIQCVERLRIRLPVMIPCCTGQLFAARNTGYRIGINDMKLFKLPCLGVIAALTSLTPCAEASQPPDTVTSDGLGNTAMGTDALLNLPASTQYNYSIHNTAAGNDALYSTTTGANNTAFGYLALYANTTGKGNEAHGAYALYGNTTGIRNIGIGSNALYDNVSGSYNIAVGFDAGYNVTNGSNNIEIGASGTSTDNGTIQIGVQGTQTSATIAGIFGSPVTGSAVYVTSTGMLGVQASSERFKTDIAPMPELSEKLNQLRPVTFHYKMDPKGVPQYGLIAEEVDKVYPELVIRDASGKIQGVHYEELAPMLLHEVQKQQSELHEQQATIKSQSARINELTEQVAALNDLKHEVRAALRQLKKDEFLAQR